MEVESYAFETLVRVEVRKYIKIQIFQKGTSNSKLHHEEINKSLNPSSFHFDSVSLSVEKAVKNAQRGAL